MKKIYFIILIIVVKNCISQDTHLTQYFIAPQTINPAAFGVINSFEAGLQYKSQWNSFTRGFTNYSAFFNKQITNKNKKNAKGFFSVGLNVDYDKSGDSKLTSISGNLPLNYSVKLNDKNYLTTGVSLGFDQKTITGSNLTWGSQYDGFNYNSSLPNENKAQQAIAVMDVGAGLALISKKNGKKFAMTTDPSNTFGFSVAHINRPNYSFYNSSSERMMMRFNLYESCNLYFDNSPYSISPSIMVQQQGSANEIILGTMLRYQLNGASYITGIRKTNSIGMGLYYRLKDALAFNAFMEHKNYIFGVSYDVNLSQLQQTSRSKGGLEIFIKIKNTGYLYKGFSNW